MTDINEEFIKSFYSDKLKQTIIEILSKSDLTDEDKINFIVEYMIKEGIE